MAVQRIIGVKQVKRSESFPEAEDYLGYKRHLLGKSRTKTGTVWPRRTTEKDSVVLQNGERGACLPLADESAPHQAKPPAIATAIYGNVSTHGPTLG
jgi:hypothetical protein